MNISNMCGAIEHWLGFQDKIGRSFMINEDTLKYPLADYLVNDGNIDVKNIKLEYAHPNFSSRNVDLAIINNINHQINNIFELKLAKLATRTQTEKQRIFNDLMRLYLAKKVTTDKCYFIIVGKTANFQRDFYKFETNGDIFYKKWFVFGKEGSITFDVATETHLDYQTIYQEFINEYSDNTPTTIPLQLPNQITTTCEFITAYDERLIPYMAGIWSVS